MTMESNAILQELETERSLRKFYERETIDLELQLEKLKMASRAYSQLKIPYWNLVVNPLLCRQYKDLMQENSWLKAEVAKLKADLDKAHEVLEKSILDRAQIFHEKQVLNDEIEELTASLFEEANRMVSYERKLRAELEASKVQLSEQLSTAINTIHSGIQKQIYKLSKSVIFGDSTISKHLLSNDKSRVLTSIILDSDE